MSTGTLSAHRRLAGRGTRGNPPGLVLLLDTTAQRRNGKEATACRSGPVPHRGTRNARPNTSCRRTSRRQVHRSSSSGCNHRGLNEKTGISTQLLGALARGKLVNIMPRQGRLAESRAGQGHGEVMSISKHLIPKHCHPCSGRRRAGWRSQER